MDIKKDISNTLRKEAEAILSVKVTGSFEEAVMALFNCEGKVLTTGIGKAGIIARKFSGTLCSTATPSAFIHPSESAHGDLGLIDSRDCVVAFSTSGKSIEVIEMIKLSHKLGVDNIIGITSHLNSELRALSDIIINMGIIQEPCPLGLTPTSSIAAMLAISDSIALALMRLKGVTKEDYSLRHHGGYLGKKSRS